MEHPLSEGSTVYHVYTALASPWKGLAGRLALAFRLPVGSGDHHHPAVKESGKQPLQDHGVRNVRHLELVKAQQVRLVGDDPGHGTNGVVGVGLFPLGRARGKLSLELVDSCNNNNNNNNNIIAFY